MSFPALRVQQGTAEDPTSRTHFPDAAGRRACVVFSTTVAFWWLLFLPDMAELHAPERAAPATTQKGRY